jgi:hypothetical protein
MSAMQPFYQVGIVVEDLEAAMRELSEGIGVTWGPISAPNIGGADLRVVFTVEGPPHIELIEGQPGTNWDTAQGSHIDHIAFWADDLDATVEGAQRGGLPLSSMQGDGRAYGLPYTYHDAEACGMRIEFIDSATREGFYARTVKSKPDAE